MSRTAVRRFLVSSLACAAALGVTACQPLENAGRTDKIEFAGTSTVNGWKFDYFRNTAYPCSISGYQTFVIGTKVGSSDTAVRPLWVRMHSGGVGYFNADGMPVGGTGNKVEESAARLINTVGDRGLTREREGRRRRLPPAVGVDVRSRHLRRRRPARSEQPQQAARRQSPVGQRAVRHQGGDSVRADALPHVQDLPPRDQRGRLRIVQRCLGAGAPGRAGGRLRGRFGRAEPGMGAGAGGPEHMPGRGPDPGGPRRRERADPPGDRGPEQPTSPTS